MRDACKRRERQREQRFRKRERLIAYLATHPCVDCGESDFRCLDFDHVTGKKFKDISLMMRSGYSWESVQKEMLKCVVRCANCHRKKTYESTSTRRYRLMHKAQVS